MDAQYGPLGDRYASVSGGSALAFVRSKDMPPARSPLRAHKNQLAARLAKDEQMESPLISRSAFHELRKASFKAAISEAGSDDEEAIPIDDDHPSSLPPGVSTHGLTVGQIDELTLLLADTPIKKLRHKEALAAKAAERGDLWVCLELRQQVLALAKLALIMGPYSPQAQHYPLLVAEAHYRLAMAYADLQCVPQTNDHCKKALQALPRAPTGETVEQVTAFKRDINVLLGEMLLLGTPPKPQAALQYVYKAAGSEDLEAITDPALKVLVAQCHALLGATKLHEAYATRQAREALEQRVSALSTKLSELRPKSSEHDQLLCKIRDGRNELQEEEAFENALLEESYAQLNRATDALMEVIDAEETRVRQQRDMQASGGEDAGYPPLILTLWRMACDLSFKMAMVAQLAGNLKDQLARLGEIVTAENSYHCVPAELMARTYQEQSAGLVSRAGQAQDQADRTADLNEALEVLDKLLLLQEERYAHSPVKQDTSRAETLKLIGNVNVALAQYGRAQTHYQEALQLFSARLGPSSPLVVDLEQRIQDVQMYMRS